MRPVTVPLKLINLQDDGFHLLAEIVAFEQKVFVVIDTGASRSVFDNSWLKRHLPALVHSDEVHATTLFTTASTLQATIPALKIGRLLLENYETVALDLEGVNQAYDSLGHPNVVGIIGSDLLLEYKAVINYKNLKLFLYNS